jgi:hypothetical protein
MSKSKREKEKSTARKGEKAKQLALEFTDTNHRIRQAQNEPLSRECVRGRRFTIRVY